MFISKETNNTLKIKKTKVFNSLDDVLKKYKEEYKYSPLLRKVSAPQSAFCSMTLIYNMSIELDSNTFFEFIYK